MGFSFVGSRSTSQSWCKKLYIVPVVITTAWIVEFTLPYNQRSMNVLATVLHHMCSTRSWSHREHQSPCSGIEKSRYTLTKRSDRRLATWKTSAKKHVDPRSTRMPWSESVIRIEQQGLVYFQSERMVSSRGEFNRPDI